MKLVVVLLGGGVGAVVRYLVSDYAANRFGSSFPYGTLIVNVVGCFVIGLFMVLATERLNISPYWRLLVTVGFLGGLTTFSSFGYETIKLLETGNIAAGIYNAALNCFLGFSATWLGVMLARLF